MTDAIESAGYCDGCGRKLPTSAFVQTRRSLARTADEGAAPDSPAAGGVTETLLLAAVLHLIGGGLFLVVGPTFLSGVSDTFLPRVMTWTLLPSLFAAGLMAPARRFPRSSAGLALVGVFLWVVLSFALDARFAAHWLPVPLLPLTVLAYANVMAYRRAR